MPSKGKGKGNFASNCRSGTFIRYLERTPKIPKSYNTEQSARYILRHPNQFKPITRRRANLVLTSFKARRAKRK